MEAFTINLAVFFSLLFLGFLLFKSKHFYWLKKSKKVKTKEIIPKFNFELKPTSKILSEVEILQLIFTEFKKERVAINYDQNPGHALIVGGSGSGKSEKYFKSEIIFNSLLETPPNMIVSDLKGDQIWLNNYGSFESLFLETKSFLKAKEFNVYKIDLIGNSNEKEMIYYNVLNIVFESKDNDVLLDKNIKMLLQQLFPIADIKNKYWIDSSRLIIESIIHYMIDIKIPKENFTLQTLIKIWKKFNDYIKYYELWEQRKNSSKQVNQNIINLIESNINLIKSKSFKETAASIDVELGNFNKGLLKKISSKHNFDMKSFYEKQSIIFIQTNGQIDTYSAYASLIIKQIIDVKNLYEKQKKLLVLLDEFNNIGYFEDLGFYLDCMRSQKVYFAIGIQSIKRFEQKYGSINQYANNFNISYLFGSTTNKEEIEYFNNQKYYQSIINKQYNRFNKLNGKTKSYQDQKLISDNDLKNNPQNYVWIKQKDYHLQKTNLDYLSKLHPQLLHKKRS